MSVTDILDLICKKNCDTFGYALELFFGNYKNVDQFISDARLMFNMIVDNTTRKDWLLSNLPIPWKRGNFLFKFVVLFFCIFYSFLNG